LAAQGFTLTLRQLYYQFVARQLIANAVPEYKRLGRIVAEGRRAGLIDWAHIEDRTRDLDRYSYWDDPSDILRSAAESYREDVWTGQTFRPEVWIEKSALTGVVKPVCNRWRVPHIATRGYPSISELYAAGRRMLRHLDEGLEPVVFYLGDHDPSGLDMSRSLRDELSLYTRTPVEVVRLGFDQVSAQALPPNPANETDKRFKQYVEASKRLVAPRAGSWMLSARNSSTA
jgi:hypothetical protein